MVYVPGVEYTMGSPEKKTGELPRSYQGLGTCHVGTCWSVLLFHRDEVRCVSGSTYVVRKPTTMKA